MPTYKVTFFFEGFQASAGVGEGSSVGWTETWYSNVGAGLDEVLNSLAVFDYVRTRVPFLANIYRIAFVRASEEGNPRNVKVRTVTTNSQGLLPNPAQVTCAVLVDFTRLPTSTLTVAAHRRMLVRGLSNDMISGNVLAGGSAALNAMTQWLRYLTGLSFVVAGVQTNDSAAVWLIRSNTPGQFRPITSLNVDPNSERTIQVASTALTGQLNAKYAIKGVHRPLFMNRVWTSKGTLPAPLIGETLGNSRRPLSGEWDHSGQISPVNYVYGSPSQYLIIGMRARDTGRPSRLTRGRRGTQA